MNHRLLDVRGLKLHAVERGEGEMAVLLHGWLDHAGSFDLLAPLLPGRTVALDFRGHGDSQWVGPGGFYHFVDYIADLDGALEALSPQESVRLVGHSMGAAAGLVYASTRPARISHLTMIDAVPLSISTQEIPARLGSYLEDLRHIPRNRRRVESVEDATQRLLKNNSLLSPSAARLLAQGGIAPDPEQENALAWKWDPLLRAHSPLPLSEPVLQLICAQAKVPILALRGETGMLPDEPDLRARFPHLKMTVHTVPGTGHHVHLDAPGPVSELIRASWKSGG
ncbi:MAG TPA: alpha/beta hydrolase [Myxococcales bacterium]|nr:alpha/beta hydrolase [Myxococcales bacterium]